MRIKIEDHKIWLCNESGGTSCMIMQKPEIDDYINMTTRPLVTNYHLKEETIWERVCCLMSKLEEACTDADYFACYALLFAELYPVFLGNSQMKNIICYRMEENKVSALFQDFADFTQKGSSFIALPAGSFVFSSLLNASCQAAVVCVDACDDLQTVCDAVSKIRKGGRLFLYTKSGRIPETLSVLPGLSERRVFGDCAVWSVTVGDDIGRFAQENNSDSANMPVVSHLFHKFEGLENLTSALEGYAKVPSELYLHIVELLWEMEPLLLSLYDVLENPELPILANVLREAAMDCYIGSFRRDEIKNYSDRMWRETKTFYEAMRAEFS